MQRIICGLFPTNTVMSALGTLCAVTILFLSSHWGRGQVSRKTVMSINTVGEILSAALLSPFPDPNLYLKRKTTFVFPVSVSLPV